MLLILQGFLAGIMLAAPVGPIGALCVHRTLIYGYKRGFLTGLGAATADLFYAGVAAFGLTFIGDFFLRFEHALRLMGIVFLVYFGVMMYRTRPDTTKHLPKTSGSVGDYLGALVLSMAHPVTIIVSGGIFLSLAPEAAAHTSKSIMLFTSVSLGSIVCWSMLVVIAYAFRKKIHENNLMTKIAKMTGIIILLCAFVLAWRELEYLK